MGFNRSHLILRQLWFLTLQWENPFPVGFFWILITLCQEMRILKIYKTREGGWVGLLVWDWCGRPKFVLKLPILVQEIVIIHPTLGLKFMFILRGCHIHILHFRRRRRVPTRDLGGDWGLISFPRTWGRQRRPCDEYANCSIIGNTQYDRKKEYNLDLYPDISLNPSFSEFEIHVMVLVMLAHIKVFVR